MVACDGETLPLGGSSSLPVAPPLSAAAACYIESLLLGASGSLTGALPAEAGGQRARIEARPAQQKRLAVPPSGSVSRHRRLEACILPSAVAAEGGGQRRDSAQVLFVIPVSSILGRLLLVPVGSTGTIVFEMGR